MLTDDPHIVIAKQPRRIRRKTNAKPARIMVDKSKPTVTADEHSRAGEAADELWQDMKRAVAE